MKLAATSWIRGVTGSSDLFITSLYVSVQNNFVPSAPVDDAPRFVPGMNLDGTSVALNVMETTGQLISLHLITGGARGKATFTVDSTNYPGIAMNYPLNGNLTEDMQFSNGQQSTTVNFNTSSGDTSIPLLIRDFGASGTIRVSLQSGKKTYALKPLNLPLDADGNGLPDRGWTAIGGIDVSTVGLMATGDLDAAGGATGTDDAVIGDGLSSYEEFRGFFVAGGYVRLNPREKEIFVDIDPEFLLAGPVASPVHVLATLGARILYLEPTEARGEGRSVAQPPPHQGGGLAEPRHGTSRTHASSACGASHSPEYIPAGSSSRRTKH